MFASLPDEEAAFKVELQEALRLHQRYRFDPAGLSRNERNRLRDLCRGLAGPA